MIGKTLGYQVSENLAAEARVFMKYAMSAMLSLAFAMCGLSQDSLQKVLSFEADHSGGRLAGWGGGPPNTIFADDTVVHSGRWAARLDRTKDSAENFSTITRAMPVDFTGTRIEQANWRSSWMK